MAVTEKEKLIMLTVGNAIMYVKALSKKPLAGTFPFSEFILGCFLSILP